MPGAVAEVLALLALAVALAAAVARPRLLPEWAAAAGGAALLVLAGAVPVAHARDALSQLAPTVGFLAALLLLAEGCRREGLFDAAGALMAVRSGGAPRRLLALVFGTAAAVTAVLSLDATVVLLTPVVFATATRLRTSPKPHVYACSHLANSASLLLPVSNLTNLLAFHASGLSFTRFAGLMALPWTAVLGVEWTALSRTFATELGRPHAGAARVEGPVAPLPLPALAVLAATLGGFVVASAAGVDAVWVAAGGAALITLPALVRGRAAPAGLVRAVEPGFLVFVLGLGVVVRAASDHGLADALSAVLPSGASAWALLGVAAVAALLANLVNNLPATLMLLPPLAAGGPAPVLAALVGVNAGPNLTYVGSLATLLWRRVLHAHDHEPDLGEFVRLGAVTVPAILLLSTAALWGAAQVLL